MAISPEGQEPGSAKRQAVEAAVLAATEDLLAEGASYANLNVERIATRAGISRTAFYFYFRDKRELLMRLTTDVSTLLYAQAETWWAGGRDAGINELSDALREIASLFREHDPILRVIVEVSTYDEEVASFWRAVVGRFADATCRRIEAEQAAGRADAGIAPQPTAFALVWMTERTYYQMLRQPDAVDAEELIAGLVGVWTRAVYGVTPR